MRTKEQKHVEYRAFEYRLYPTPSQEKNLCWVLECGRNLYNIALAEWKYGYQLDGRQVNLAEMEGLAKRYRTTFPQATLMHSQIAQSVVKQLHDTCQKFFKRLKQGKKPGHPRFKGPSQFHSFEFKQYGNGAEIDGRRLKLFGIGRVRVRWHREIEGTIKKVRLICKAGKWYAIFICVVPDPKPLPKTGRVIGLDVGINALLTTSEGEKVSHPHWYRVAQSDLRRKQRALARAKKGSRNRSKKLLAVQHQYEKVVQQRGDYLNKLIYHLVQHCDRIALEDLAITNMVHNHHLSKSILESGWGYFKKQLTIKAASAGREIVLVDPAYTSRTCSKCGVPFDGFTLSVRWVECACGLSLDRDHNAALNILYRAGWVTSVSRNAAPLFSPVQRE